jgi:SAM-dependent methyltransferase
MRKAAIPTPHRHGPCCSDRSASQQTEDMHVEQQPPAPETRPSADTRTAIGGSLRAIVMTRRAWIQRNCRPGQRILDIGGNTGQMFEGWLDSRNVTTVDLDLYGIPNFVRASAERLPFMDKAYDIAVLAEILEHCQAPVRALAEARRVARTKVIVTVPNEWEWPDAYNPFMPSGDAARAKGLTIEQMAHQDNPAIAFYTNDGYRHLHHNRYYTIRTLREDLAAAGLLEKAVVSKLYDPLEVAHFVAVCPC